MKSSGLLVWECEGDRAAGEMDEGERGAWAVEAVGASGDQPRLVVERFDAGLVDTGADRGEDAGGVLGDGLAQADEGPQAAAGGPRAEAVDQLGDVGERQAAGEDRAQRFLEGVGAPDAPAGTPQLAQGGGLGGGVVVGVFKAAPSARL